MHVILADFSFGGDWKVEIDVSVVGMQIYISRQVRGNFERDAAIAGFEPPAAGERGAVAGTHVDVSVASFEFEFVKASIGLDVAIAGGSAQPAIDAIEVQGAIACVHIHLAL